MCARVVNYRLGRDCVLAINGLVVFSVRNSAVRSVPVTADATPRGMAVTSTATVVLARSLEIEFDVIDIGEAQTIYALAAANQGEVFVSLGNGFWEGTKRFTLHDIDSSEDIGGAVAPRFLLRERYDAQFP